jgi:hypothetical protein
MIIEPASLARDVRSKNLKEGSFSACSLWSFELLFGRIRLCRTEALGCPPKTQFSPGCPAAEALRHNGSHGSRTKAAGS